MCSFLQKEARITENFPCPECGEMQLHYVTEDIILRDGKKILNLRHLKCAACNSRFFDDEAIRKINRERRKTESSA